MKKIIVLFALTIICLVFASSRVFASDAVTDWYIKDFQSEIIVNKDSSLDITEKISADCGNLSDKHGIFRVVPYQSYGDNGEKFDVHVSLESIADSSGNLLHYQESVNRSDETITWKIGDANKTVTGINNYVIKYHVANAIRSGNTQFDELYWNLNGNFWDIETEKYAAKIVFPDDFDRAKSEVSIYSGSFGTRDSAIAHYSWDGNALDVMADQPLKPKEGITISATSPKNYFVPYVPTFWERYSFYIYLLIPVLISLLCFNLWSRFGKDPKVSSTIAPEFEIPEKLSPIDMGMIISDGSMKNVYLTAGIVNLAVNKSLKIEQTAEKGFLSKAQYIFHSVQSERAHLSESEKVLKERIFDGSESIQLSELENKFYAEIPAITTASMNFLCEKNWLTKSSRAWMAAFIGFGVITGFAGFSFIAFDTSLAIILIVSAVIWFAFAPFMRRRSLEGAQLLKRIQGFEMYMKKAEIYRQQWLEKQDIFEQFLPYAIIFGIAKEWMKKLRDIYGEKYFSSYVPVWYYGYAGSFDFDSFGDNLNSMTSNMAQTLSSSPSSSGVGGGGFSGGGGGGGGGGGW